MNINIKLKRSDRFHFTLDNNNLTYATSQKVEIIEYFSKLLLEENFDYIIELGTHKGGFSIILDEIKKENKLKVKIITVDFGKWSDDCKNHDVSIFDDVLNEYYKREIEFKLADILSDSTIQCIKEYILKGKCLILCDGGNKIVEFDIYSKLIKSGDFIGCHDYEDGSSENGWQWKEAKYESIENSVISQNLVKYDKLNFNDVAWSCFKKYK